MLETFRYLATNTRKSLEATVYFLTSIFIFIESNFREHLISRLFGGYFYFLIL